MTVGTTQPASEPVALADIPNAEHERWMRVALGLARRGAGSTWPNPNVGCILLRDGQVVGRGWTRQGGRPHAEAVALAQAGPAAAGAIAYVTLEPCAHHGVTPPCAQALVAAGVRGCVIGATDPDPRVNGGGVAILEAAGVAVLQGVCEMEARWVMRGFLHRVVRSRPWVTCKLATSLDGRTTAADGRSQWITGPQARAHGHLLRARHDLILIGMGTLRSDDPLLTCRLPGLAARSPVRAVAATGRNLPLDCRLFAQAGGEGAAEPPVWLLHGDSLDHDLAAVLDRRGIRRLPVGGRGRPDPAAIMSALSGEGITRVLLEGGSALATAFLQADMVDSLAWYRAGHVLGSDGLAGFGRLPPVDLTGQPGWRREDMQELGPDVLETFVRAG